MLQLAALKSFASLIILKDVKEKILLECTYWKPQQRNRNNKIAKWKFEN